MLPLRRPAAVLLALALAASVRAGAWPQVQSDLPQDPAVLWGVLPNGIRYAVRHNAEPKGRASLRFVVAAGSIDERESERGIAHFIEHMAFRGTREHPNGGMTAELQRLGVGFGPDTAAFTFWDHTLYELELPDTDEATLRTGLGVFREYAQDISFDPALIDRERDVILNERDTRDTPPARATDANVEMLWPGSRLVERKPIGLVENIRRFNRAQFLDLYDAWYRPDRMAVVVVGDVDPAAVAGLIGSAMGGITARGPARTDEIALSPSEAGNANIRVFIDKGLPGAECEMEHPFPEAASPETHERRVAQLRRALAFSILQRRAARFSKSSDGKFLVPVAATVNSVPGWAIATFGASGTIGNWQAFMADLESEQRRAFEYGFTAAELATSRTAFVGAYEDAVRTSATWHSDWVAGAIVNSIVQGIGFSTPAAVLADLSADLASATPADCLAEFRRAWGTASMHVFVGTNPTFRVTAPEIAEALNASRKKPVARPVEEGSAVFAYTNFGPAGTLSASGRIDDL
ncbi:MAG TPA: insulinase family protein, partial [Opitutaceae bacterium]